MLLLRQVLALVYKNVLIAFFRRKFTTVLRALILPIVFGWFLAYARNFFIPPAYYGIGEARPIRSIADAFPNTGSRTDLVFVNNAFTGGQIEQVITNISTQAREAGRNVQVIEREEDLLTACRNSLRGSSSCIAGVVFHSSPSEPENEGAIWNYTLRYDGALSTSVRVDEDNNDQEIFVLPLQRSIDAVISVLSTDSASNQTGSTEVEEYPYTNISQEEREIRIRVRYMDALINILGVAFFIGICGIQYQQVGAQATERELKMSQLIEVMMPNKRRWEPQLARLASYHIAFTLLYFPGWLFMAIILQAYVFARTSLGIVIVFHLLTGLSLASFSLFAASFFKKAQLSGITTILLSLVLAIIAQVFNDMSNGAVAICSLLFPSMNYTLFITYMARFEAQDIGTNLTESAPENPAWSLTGVIFWVLLIVQILVYPILAVIVERILWGTTSGDRHLSSDNSGAAVELQGFSKYFEPSWFQRNVLPLFGKKKKETVRAVDALNLSARPGQITLLLGANGSGKSTTLDAIAGLSKPTHGSIALDFGHGLGFCPQHNVLWKDLTVFEHIDIFDRIKSIDYNATREEKINLIRDCDLSRKIGAKAGSLSGGQMRKLQLASMFIGKSRICLVDECSSGIDPLARRKIQDIILMERSRSKRTVIFTSHYLDEADIADHIIIMSKGQLKMEGTAPEVKQSGQYKIHAYHNPGSSNLPHFDGVNRREMYDQTVYTVEDAAATADLLSKIEAMGFKDYTVSGPTVEDAFMKVAEEMVPSKDKVVDKYGRSEDVVDNKDTSPDTPPDTASEEKSPESLDKELDLHSGNQIGPFRQGAVLFVKRCLVFGRNVYPNLAAFFLVPIAAALASLFLQGFPRAGCTREEQISTAEVSSLASVFVAGVDLVVGPTGSFGPSDIINIVESVPTQFSASVLSNEQTASFFLGMLSERIHTVETLEAFNDYIAANYTDVIPGGIWFGNSADPVPTLAYLGNRAINYPVYLQNMFTTTRLGQPIGTQYQPFDTPWQAGQGDTLQYTIYFGLVICIAPAFFALYPTLERLRHVRGLHYSNGVRALPLWLAYTAFDFAFVLLGASIAVAILAARFNPVFFDLGLFWVVLTFYGLCATLFSYVVSLYANSQLGAFAIAAAYQAVTALLYIIAYLATVTFADTNLIDRNLNIVHFTMSLIMPAGSLFKSLFVSLNILSINCRGTGQYISSGGDITAYGGPILYLVVQCALLFFFLVWWDSGNKFRALLPTKHRDPDQEEKNQMESDVQEELQRVTESTDDGLRVLHLTKAFGKNVAVDDASFGVRRGEVFGLLGPNGAGKSTTISVIRGDIKASNNGGDVFIEQHSLLKKRSVARQHLSACPQHDAMDRLTVLEHLRFYARIRGVKAVEHNVKEIVRAVGLGKFQNRMAEALSGGNKRKLSLGIALMGNPAVMLLDEPSSGMDVAAKRVMWRTLESVVAGRSIVLTTHSMEEADRLCNRAGILAKRMLAVGTSDYLRKKHGDRYFVHLLLKSAPYTTEEETENVKAWIQSEFRDAEIDPKSFHGQIRFSIPVQGIEEPVSPAQVPLPEGDLTSSLSEKPQQPAFNTTSSGIASLFTKLESSKAKMGFEYYSVSQTTLDQVFLSIVGKHNIEEENAGVANSSKPDYPARRTLRENLRTCHSAFLPGFLFPTAKGRTSE